MKWQVLVRYRLLLGLIALFIIAGLAAPAVAQRPRADPQQGPPRTQGVQLAQTVKIPQLTEEERAQVLSIATGDKQVQKLLDGRQYLVTTVGVWHTYSLKKIGGGVIFTLAEPATLEADWVGVEYNDKEDTWPPYKSNLRHFAAKEVQRLAVLVDLQKGKVVQIMPGPEAKIEQPQ